MTTTGPVTPETAIVRNALIHDLAIMLAGSLHPSAEIGPAPRLAARRMQDVLGIEDGETVRRIEARLRSALGSEDEPRIVYTHDIEGAIIAVDARQNH
jgi:hypothetical protein